LGLNFSPFPNEERVESSKITEDQLEWEKRGRKVPLFTTRKSIFNILIGWEISESSLTSDENMTSLTVSNLEKLDRASARKGAAAGGQRGVRLARPRLRGASQRASLDNARGRHAAGGCTDTAFEYHPAAIERKPMFRTMGEDDQPGSSIGGPVRGH
jgi:hypothetical protein